MNKEEIEKEDKEHLIEVLTEHKDYIFEFADDNIKIEYILDYIRKLEFQNTALKAEHNHNITRIKDLEQKESILDKVIDIVKIIIKRTETECMYGTTDMLEDLQKILKIIEGEKK